MSDPAAIQDFIRELSDEEVRRVLAADPLGIDWLTKHAPTPDPSEMRWQAFEVFFARPRFFREVLADKRAAAVNSQRQLQLFAAAR